MIEWSDECGKLCDEQVTGNKISYLVLSNPHHEMIYTLSLTHTHASYIHAVMLPVSFHDYFILTKTTPLSICLCSFFVVFLSSLLHLGVPVVMMCALGAAGMTITIHGSLANDCTQWTLMREGEERTEERRSKRYQRERDWREKMAAEVGYYFMQLLQWSNCRVFVMMEDF